MVSVIAGALGVLGVGFNVAFAWPQVWRARTSAEGVAIGTVVTGFFGRLLWTSYAVRAADVPLFVGQAPVAVGFAAIAVMVARAQPQRRATLLLGMLITIAATVAITPMPRVLATSAVVVAAIVNLPQMISVIRNPGGSYGVAALMYWLTSCASATWLAYGIAVQDLTISAPHIILLPTGLATAIIVQRRKLRH